MPQIIKKAGQHDKLQPTVHFQKHIVRKEQKTFQSNPHNVDTFHFWTGNLFAAWNLIAFENFSFSSKSSILLGGCLHRCTLLLNQESDGRQWWSVQLFAAIFNAMSCPACFFNQRATHKATRCKDLLSRLLLMFNSSRTGIHKTHPRGGKNFVPHPSKNHGHPHSHRGPNAGETFPFFLYLSKSEWKVHACFNWKSGPRRLTTDQPHLYQTQSDSNRE